MVVYILLSSSAMRLLMLTFGFVLAWQDKAQMECAVVLSFYSGTDNCEGM